MTLTANFENIIFNEHLGDDQGDLATFSGMTFVGDQSKLVNFTIEGTPNGKGYLLLYLWSIQDLHHKIEINNINVSNATAFPHQLGSEKNATWIIPIDENVLKKGNNTLQIKRSGNDNFHVYSVIVNWKEEVDINNNTRPGFFGRLFSRG
jgi:hypothetical protein